MRGLMMDTPLLISSLIEYAALYHAGTEIVSRTVEGPIHRTTYLDARNRSKQLAGVLQRLGVEPGDRVGTLAWNGYRHFEIYYAVSGMGAVCHTINPRLFAEQLVYIINHAEDAYLFVDLTFVPLLESIQEQIPGVRGYVVMTDAEHMPETSLPNALCYEELMARESADFDWPALDENTASSLCYTSGTTGHPKGALFSHRSTVLHSYSACSLDTLGVCSRTIVLPVVPMFHANAWGLPYAAALAGAKLVMPGARLDGEGIHQLVEAEEVDLLAGVPTVWLMLLGYLEQNGKTIDSVEKVVIGGAAAPRSMIEAFQQRHGATVIHAWGMTETSPIGTIGTLKRQHDGLPEEERVTLQLKQGRGVYGIELRIVDDEGNELPRDGVAFGELQVRGPWVVRSYFRHDGEILGDEGWFSTGDVATLSPDGFMQITDRSKDVIKSGGEWISSIDLENEVVSHPSVAEAAVIGIAHPKWDERPLLVVVPAEGAAPERDEILSHLEGRIVKWWMPDDVVFVDELPHTATGKISKLTLREQFSDYQLPTA
ncbi:MAG: long-chain-fatty-acid--CoA ligase [bacterium]|nr:long-chain-fatty-acid--CoA ligase [bacterium]